MIWSFFKMISLTTKFVMLILLCFKILTHKHVHEGSGVRVEVGSHMGVGDMCMGGSGGRVEVGSHMGVGSMCMGGSGSRSSLLFCFKNCSLCFKES